MFRDRASRMVLAVFTVAFAIPQVGWSQVGDDREKEQTHSEKMKAAMPPDLPSDIGDRIYDRLFDVEAQIKTTRMLMARMRQILAHREATEEDQAKLALYKGLLQDLGEARTHLTQLHLQIAECTVACAEVEQLAAKGLSGHTPEHHTEMANRTKAAGKALAGLQKAIGDLGARQRELGDEDLARLIDYLAKEAKALGAVVAECRSALGETDHGPPAKSGKKDAEKDGKKNG